MTKENLNVIKPKTEAATSGPLFNKNKMKLGVFGLNVNSAGAITTSPDRHEIDWDQNVRLVRMAESAGFEAAVPFARWCGFGGKTNPWGNSFETFTWAAGMAASTSKIALIATVNMLTTSPVTAAKQLATIDHISGGRAVLNVVAGWMKSEMQMFGVATLSHEDRYAQGAEWMNAASRLLTEDETFELKGKYIQLEGAYQQPKAIQSPRPVIMNAAFSTTGHGFASQWADVAFISPNASDPGNASEQVQGLQSMAEKHGRKIQVWVATSIAAAETEEEARAYVDKYSGEQIDAEAAENCVAAITGGTEMPKEQLEVMKKNIAAHIGGFPLVGSYQQVADKITALSESGVAGLCLTWMDYEKGLPTFIEHILPLMEDAGLRLPYDHEAGQ